MTEPFSFMLASGHPNSLGRTLEVVAAVEREPDRLQELYDCYRSADEVVRLRTSSSLKRVFTAHPEKFDVYCDRLLDEISQIPQPSTQWTLAQWFHEHEKRMSAQQTARAKALLVRNLASPEPWAQDWIVLNMTMKTLRSWLKRHPDLEPLIAKRISELADDRRRSVANGARKVLKELKHSPL
jgi:hypothetical protein